MSSKIETRTHVIVVPSPMLHTVEQEGGGCVDVQGAGKEGIAPELLNGIEAVLALHQQAQVGLQNVAVGDAADSYGRFPVNQSADAHTLGILPNQRQTGIGGEILEEFFDSKVCHVVLTFLAGTILRLSH